MKQPVIYDTTLREGMQTPGGIGGTLDERLYAAGLIAPYAHWLELGMPANNVDFEIISAAAKKLRGTNAGIAVLARCNDLDIDRAAEVMEGYDPSCIHLFVGTSPQHMKHRFGGKDETFYLSLIERMVAKASASPVFERIMFSPEDAYRTYEGNPEWLMEVIDAAKRGHGNRNDLLVINLPDTVGKSTVNEFASMMQRVRDRFGASIDISTHSHNDSGMAEAQSIDAYERFDASWIQCCFAQLGERNGLASTGRIVKALVDRTWLNDTRICDPANLAKLDPTTNAVLYALGRQPPAEEIERCTYSTAGIHTSIALKDHGTYHIHGDKYGSTPRVELGPTSGSHQVQHLLDQHGVRYDNRINAFTDMLKSEANMRKAPLTQTHVMHEAYRYFEGMDPAAGISVTEYLLSTRKDGRTHIRVVGMYEGKAFTQEHDSAGPVEAIIEVLQKVLGESHCPRFSLIEYSTRIVPVLDKKLLDWHGRPELPLGIGKDAHLAVSVSIRNGHGTYEGWAADRNSTVAEVDAIIDGVSKMYDISKWQSRQRHSNIPSTP